MRHDELVELGRKWVYNEGYRLIVTEFPSKVGEVPDVIGWSHRPGWGTIQIEAKASVADFRADKNKGHRMGPGLGRWRYYIAREGLLPLGAMPVGWGLIETDGEYTRSTIPAPDHEQLGHQTKAACLALENQLLVSVMMTMKTAVRPTGRARNVSTPVSDKRKKVLDEWLQKVEAEIKANGPQTFKEIILNAGDHPYKTDAMARRELKKVILAGEVDLNIDTKSVPAMVCL